MADDTHGGPGAIPAGVDAFTLLAEGFFPGFAPRSTEPHEMGPELRDALERSCAASSTWDPAALLAQPPIETTLASIHTPSKAAAGLPAILSSFKHALPRLGVINTGKVFLSVNQKDGFDCQSCAWPTPDGERHQFEFCENGAKAMASEGGKRTIGADFFRAWSIDKLAGQSDEWLDAQGRLIEPLYRREGAAYYEPIAWEDAFRHIGKVLRELPTPGHATFYTSGRASNEAAFLYQLFVRQFGTNNMPDCSNMCHESSGTALVESLGIGKGTVTLEDFEHTDMILIVGQNPGTNHPRMLTSLEHAKKQGAKIIAINPLPEPGFLRFADPNPDEFKSKIGFAMRMLDGGSTALADMHLPVRINGDIALYKGLMKVMLEVERTNGGVLDHAFIHELTDGFEALKADIEGTSWQEIVDGCGIAREEIEKAGRMMAESKRMMACWAMGLTQHRDAVDTIRMLVNMLLLGGHIGRPGAGTCCVRGHSNVQGDRTMGVWERPTGPFLDAMEREFQVPMPRQAGHDVVDSIAAMHAGEIDVFIALGGNFLAASPDTVCTAEALRKLSLTVNIATKLNRGHLVTGRESIILPCLGRSEKDPAGFVTVEDAMGVVSSSRGPLDPAGSNLRSEVAIIAGVAKETLGTTSKLDWTGLGSDYGRIRDHISRVVPGFADFNAKIAVGPFYLPNPARQRHFITSTGKAHFAVAPISDHDLGADKYILMTIRSHDQFNTTVYGLNDRYRGVHGGRRVLFMNPDDIAARGWEADQRVDITSHFRGEERMARRFQLVPHPIPRRCLAAYFPEANVLVPLGSVAEWSNTPTSKSIHVTLERSA